MPERHLLSVGELTRSDILGLFASASRFVHEPREQDPFLTGFFFFSDSLRTRVGFECATARLGGASVLVKGSRSDPTMSGSESWTDTVRSVGLHFDVICVRHPDENAAAQAASLLPGVSVINCGNGAREHPTQALIDLHAVHQALGGAPDGLRVTIVGDLRGMRAAHSLLLALARFEDVTVTGVSPEALTMPDDYVRPFTDAGNTYRSMSELVVDDRTDVLYIAGFPRVAGNREWADAERAPYRVERGVVAALRPDALILCPLPRIDEIDPALDESPQALYFRQSRWGLAMRMAILERSLGPRDGS